MKNIWSKEVIALNPERLNRFGSDAPIDDSWIDIGVDILFSNTCTNLDIWNNDSDSISNLSDEENEINEDPEGSGTEQQKTNVSVLHFMKKYSKP